MSDQSFFDIAYTLKTDAEAKAMYDRWAEIYDQDLIQGDYQQPARCAEALAHQQISKQAKILDVGCGTGLSGMALKAAGFGNLHGCDLSDGMLEKAKQLEIYDQLFSCNLNEPPIAAKDQEFDALTAVGVFSFGHVEADAVDELLRVCKSKAIIIIGLNDHFYKEGSLVRKLEALEKSQKLKIIARDYGEHIPANDLKGWVITIQKL